MGDTVLYMRGPFPFGMDRGVSADLVADAKATLEVDRDLLDAIATELESFPGYLDKHSVRDIIGQYVSNEEQCQRLSRLVFGVGERLRLLNQNVEDLLSNISDWQQDDENREQHLLSPQEFGELQDRLPLIIRHYPGLRRQVKAKNLSESTGNRLEDLAIICDLRPVFDEERQKVEGVIPFTTLKVVCKGVDGLPVSLEAILSEMEVHDLAKKAGAAVEKLKCLRDLLAAQDLPIPPLDMTKRGE